MVLYLVCVFVNDTATTEIYTYGHTLSLHDALPISAAAGGFAREIIPVDLGEGRTHTADETVRASTTPEGLAGLNPSFVDPAFAARFPEIDRKSTRLNSSH